jgi:RNA polymerase sigma factor (sigma-70 family)
VNTTTGNNETDKQLINRVLGSDAQAFGIIIKNTERLVGQIVFKMIGNPEDRKDIAQDIYLKVYRKLPDFKFQAKLSTWIAQVSYNTCVDHLRKKKLVLPGNIYELKEPGNNDADWQTDNFILQKNISGLLKTEIEKLSPVYRTLITLYHNEELSYEEIGQITGLPAGTVKSYLYRARKVLKDSLMSHYKKEEL